MKFLKKLYMFIQKRKTISVVFLFCNHLSADKGKPATRFSLVDEKGLQKGKTANCFSPLIKHRKFYEEMKEKVREKARIKQRKFDKER